jgi:hypothetical protein
MNMTMFPAETMDDASAERTADSDKEAEDDLGELEGEPRFYGDPFTGTPRGRVLTDVLPSLDVNGVGTGAYENPHGFEVKSAARTAQVSMTVYHGSRECGLTDAEDFDLSSAGGRGYFGTGLYTTPEFNEAAFYGHCVYEFEFTGKMFDEIEPVYRENNAGRYGDVSNFEFYLNDVRFISWDEDEDLERQEQAFMEKVTGYFSSDELLIITGDYNPSFDDLEVALTDQNQLAEAVKAIEEEGSSYDPPLTLEDLRKLQAAYNKFVGSKSNKPKVETYQLDPTDIGSEVEAKGYDAVLIPGLELNQGHTEILVFNPERTLKLVRMHNTKTGEVIEIPPRAPEESEAPEDILPPREAHVLHESSVESEGHLYNITTTVAAVGEDYTTLRATASIGDSPKAEILYSYLDDGQVILNHVAQAINIGSTSKLSSNSCYPEDYRSGTRYEGRTLAEIFSCMTDEPSKWPVDIVQAMYFPDLPGGKPILMDPAAMQIYGPEPISMREYVERELTKLSGFNKENIELSWGVLAPSTLSFIPKKQSAPGYQKRVDFQKNIVRQNDMDPSSIFQGDDLPVFLEEEGHLALQEGWHRILALLEMIQDGELDQTITILAAVGRRSEVKTAQVKEDMDALYPLLWRLSEKGIAFDNLDEALHTKQAQALLDYADEPWFDSLRSYADTSTGFVVKAYRTQEAKDEAETARKLREDPEDLDKDADSGSSLRELDRGHRDGQPGLTMSKLDMSPEHNEHSNSQLFDMGRSAQVATLEATLIGRDTQRVERLVREDKQARIARLIQKSKDGEKQWALVSRKDSSKVLKWFGKKKPSEEAVAKEEKRVQYFKNVK